MNRVMRSFLEGGPHLHGLRDFRVNITNLYEATKFGIAVSSTKGVVGTRMTHQTSSKRCKLAITLHNLRRQCVQFHQGCQDVLTCKASMSSSTELNGRQAVSVQAQLTSLSHGDGCRLHLRAIRSAGHHGCSLWLGW